MSSLCSSCNAEIVWVLSPNGKRMPIDAKAVDSLDEAMRFLVLYAIAADNDEEPARVVGVKRSEGYEDLYAREGGLWHPSHFSTCPFAGQHSKQAQR
jgi:hypothetical protein